MTINTQGQDSEKDRFRLPAVTGVEIRRVRFDQPKRFYSQGRLVEAQDAVELLIRTNGPLPVRDLTPVIFIGDTPVDEYQQIDVNFYRFFAYEFERLTAGASISLGWPYAPESKIPSNFHFDLPLGLPVS